MTAALRFDPIRLPPECEQLRKEVRAFLAEEIAAGTFDPHKPNREDTDAPEFSRRVGAKGWLGMTWPKKYGGHERSFLERYVVTEEMRVANATTFNDEVFLEAVAAKIRCSEAAEKGGGIAHQVHGAIGFTMEHILHRYSLRALAWRDDFGSESYWAVELGKLVCNRGADELWPLVASR